MKKNNFLLITGGTGGHVLPAINFGNYLIEAGYKCTIILDKRGLKYTKNFKGKIIIIGARHFAGNFIYKILSFLILIFGFIKSFYYLFLILPKHCIAFGGYASAMPLIAARILNFFKLSKIHLHEQNSVIGKVNSIFLPYAENIFTNFLEVKKINNSNIKKICHVGLPSSNNLSTQNLIKSRDKNKFNILVYGGSQGSINLNTYFTSLLKKLPNSFKNKISVVIQNSSQKIINDFEKNNHLNVKIYSKPYFDDIHSIIKSSDLVIARSGAGTINDIILTQIPAIFVPLPHAVDNHQYYNAKYLVDNKAAKMISEQDLNTNTGLLTFKEILLNDKIRLDIIENLKLIKILNTNNLMLKKILNE